MAHKIERAVLAQRIRELDGLTNDERSALLELLNTKKFGLVWENKLEDVEERLRESLPVLKEVKEKALTQGGADAPNHIIIEGDNLEALTALSYTHEGKIDVIYIDPPYNTGNKDFVYNDNYVDAEDGYRHSKWLSFMSRRLKIAKRLLSDRGVIFISIDDNEQANLKLLCDEVFGEGNYLNNFAWITNITGRQISGAGAAKTWESILCYSKRFEQQEPLNVNINFAKSKMPDTYKGFKKDIRVDNFGEFAIGDTLYNHNRKFNEETRPNLVFSIFYNPVTQEIIPGDIGSNKEGFVEILPHSNGDGKHKYHAWRWSRNKIINESYNLIVLPKGRNDYEVHTKIRDFNDTILKDLITNISNGDSELQSILGSKKFDYPKSVDLIKLLIGSIAFKSSFILDFFAGSGTTLHATMQLNEEDKGHRQCILVTNNENNICEEVAYERNKRVINGYTTSKSVAVEGLHGNNLRYYKVGFVPRENTLSAKRQLMAASTDLLCIKNGIYTEQSQFGTLALKPNIARYFEENGKRMLVIFREEAIEKLVAEIKRMTLDEPIITYVFSSNNYAMDADFEEVEDKVSLCALPAAIYNAYLKVLPKRKAKNPENEDAGESGESMEEQQKLDFGEEETL